MEQYVWEGSVSQKVIEMLAKSPTGETTVKSEAIPAYVSATTKLHNQGEDKDLKIK